jgi:hypothetical protein
MGEHSVRLVRQCPGSGVWNIGKREDPTIEHIDIILRQRDKLISNDISIGWQRERPMRSLVRVRGQGVWIHRKNSMFIETSEYYITDIMGRRDGKAGQSHCV